MAQASSSNFVSPGSGKVKLSSKGTVNGMSYSVNSPVCGLKRAILSEKNSWTYSMLSGPVETSHGPERAVGRSQDEKAESGTSIWLVTATVYDTNVNAENNELLDQIILQISRQRTERKLKWNNRKTYLTISMVFIY